jgi:hypothetical protein
MPMGPRLLPLLVLLAAASAGAQDPDAEEEPHFAGVFALPYVPCDCDPGLLSYRARRPIPGYAEPDTSAAAVRTLEAGTLMAPADRDRELAVTVLPVRTTAARDVVVPAPEVYGPIRYLSWARADAAQLLDSLLIPEGAVVELLAVDMGYAYFRYDGVVYGSGALWGDLDWPATPIQTETWYRLVATADVPAAWVRLDFAEPPDGNAEIACETYPDCGP